jgi:hypothetical protein
MVVSLVGVVERAHAFVHYTCNGDILSWDDPSVSFTIDLNTTIAWERYDINRAITQWDTTPSTRVSLSSTTGTWEGARDDGLNVIDAVPNPINCESENTTAPACAYIYFSCECGGVPFCNDEIIGADIRYNWNSNWVSDDPNTSVIETDGHAKVSARPTPGTTTV